jgi:hypothetical protein
MASRRSTDVSSDGAARRAHRDLIGQPHTEDERGERGQGLVEPASAAGIGA